MSGLPPLKEGHNWADLVAANRGVFRTLHVESLTGFTIPPPAFNPNLVVDTLVVNTTSTFSGAVTINAPVDVNGDIEVDNIHVLQNGTFDGDIVANNIRAILSLRGGTGTIDGALTVGTNATVSGTLTVTAGPSTLGGTTTATTLNATTVNVSGVTTLNTLAVSGTATINLLNLTNLNVSGTTTTNALVASSATVNGPATVNGALQANTITAVTSVTTPSLNATNVTAQNITAPGTIAMLGTVNLGAVAAASASVSGPLSANAGTFGTLTVSGLASLNGGATIPATKVLTLTNSTLNGTGTAAIVMQGNITSTAGQVTAPIASLPAIINVSTINGQPYPPPAGGLPLDATFNNLTVNTAFVSNGTAQFHGLTVPTGNVSVTNNVGVTGTTTTGALVVSGTSTLQDVSAANVTASASVTAPSAALTAITGVSTINGQPYPPPASSSYSGPRGAPIALANGGVWPTLTIPAGGYGEYQIANSSIAGIASNAAIPTDPYLAPLLTCPIINAIGGPGASTLLEIIVHNFTKFFYVIAPGSLPQLNGSAGPIFMPGTIARFTRKTTLDPWNVYTTPLVYSNNPVTSLQSVDSLPNITSGSGVGIGDDPVVNSTQVQYTWMGTSPVGDQHMSLVLSGRGVISVSTTGSTKTGPAQFIVNLPVGNATNWPTSPVVAPYSKGWGLPWGYMPDPRVDVVPSRPLVGLGMSLNLVATVPMYVQLINDEQLNIRPFESSPWTVTTPGGYQVTFDFRIVYTKVAYRASF